MCSPCIHAKLVSRTQAVWVTHVGLPGHRAGHGGDWRGGYNLPNPAFRFYGKPGFLLLKAVLSQQASELMIG